MKTSKIVSAVAVAVLGTISLSACDSSDVINAVTDYMAESSDSSTSGTVTSTEITPVTVDGEIPEWSSDIAPDYYLVTGPAVTSFAPDLEEGDFVYCDLDSLGRSQCAVALMTSETRAEAKATDRADISSLSPSGWGYNDKTEIPSASSEVEGNYKGYFYNRSHLIADSLGGEAIVENVVTGTRTQNVGNRNNAGGMAYAENIARDCLDASSDNVLYYAVEAQYNGDELLPRTTTIDMKGSCDIDMHIVVFNAANGFDVNYATGEWSAK